MQIKQTECLVKVKLQCWLLAARKSSMEFISPEQLRLDGRRPKELRQLQCEIGVLGQQADGSATFSMGNTKARLEH